MKPRFKVGDIVSEKSQSRLYLRKIIKVDKSLYYCDQNYESPCGYKALNRSYYIGTLNEACELYYKDIVNTKIARKVYPKAELLENGKLRIKC